MNQQQPAPLSANMIIGSAFHRIVLTTGMLHKEVFEKIMQWMMATYPSPSFAAGFAENQANLVIYRFTNGQASFEDLLVACQALNIECDIAMTFPEMEKEKTYPEAYWDLEIDELDITVRAARLLKTVHKPGIDYIGQLVKLSEDDLVRIDGMGRLTLKQIREAVHNFGLKLGADVGDWKPPVCK